jgi:hypothetical protein
MNFPAFSGIKETGRLRFFTDGGAALQWSIVLFCPLFTEQSAEGKREVQRVE